MIIRLSMALLAALLFALLPSEESAAQGTSLTPPGVQWGSQGTTIPTPTQQIGYDSGTGLPCIVGSTATCGMKVAVAPVTGTGSVTGPTITSSSAQALASGNRRFLYIGNESTTATIACNFGGTAAINTAGNFTIPPGNGRTWSATFIPSEAVNCISSAATSPATIQVN